MKEENWAFVVNKDVKDDMAAGNEVTKGLYKDR
jgi:hypothetical protein